MRQELKRRLKIWQDDIHAGESKRVMLSPSPSYNGEFIITLEKAIHESLGNKKAHFVVRKKYLTTAQDNSLMDPASDLSQLDSVIESLDKEFIDKYDQAINKAFMEEIAQLIAQPDNS